MSTVERPPLGNFEERLLVELRAHAARQAGPPIPQTRTAPARRWLQWRPRRAALIAAATGASAVVVGAVSALPGAQPALAAAFPILTQRPQALPAYMRRALRSEWLATRGFATDREHAYAFRTPSGTGFVVVDQQTRWLCILIPDPGSGAGVRCATSTQLLSEGSRGLRLVVSGRGAQTLVALLPSGSSATVAKAGRTPRPLTLTNGVLTIVARHPVSITTTVDGRSSTTTYR